MPTLTVPQAFALAVQCHQNGRLEEAQALYGQVLAAEPSHADAWNNLGIVLAEQGKAEEAARSYRAALELRPGFPEAHNNLGNLLKNQGKLDEAVSAYRQALQIKPDYPEAHVNLGLALLEQGHWNDAAAACRRALQFEPKYAKAHNVLGAALARQGSFDEAVAAYRRALELKPGYVEAWVNLGIALAELRRLNEAMAAYGEALKLKPNSAEARTHLANALWARGQRDDALMAYRQAIQLQPNLPEAHNYLGFALKDAGQVEEAVEAFRRAIQIKPHYREAHSNLVYTLHYAAGQDNASIAAEKQRWSRQFAGAAKREVQPRVTDRRPDRRLRIGYVSPDFREHVVGLNLLPLLKGHDRGQFEILCYSGVVRPDHMTGEIRQLAGKWRNTVGVSDDAMADMIREDRVDILVDLSQHMGGDRLPVFARQPAPVQASFGGYPETTGLEAIGRRISDRYLEAKIGDGRSEIGGALPSPIPDLRPAEQVFLLDSFWCYDSRGSDVAVNALPAQDNGHVTFGSLNNFCKINDPVLRLWGRALAQVKGSRLILLSPVGAHREHAIAVLEQEGVAAARVEFVEMRPRADYLRLYHRLDIALDPFPYGGHTTSLDALWMGVAVISLAGDRAVSRAGESQLSNLELPELLAFSEADYCRIATDLARDLPRLAQWRRALRARMEASPLMDARRFVAGIEAAYRVMWRNWCAENPPSPRWQ